MSFGPGTRRTHPIAAVVCNIAGIAAVASAFCIWLGPAGFVQVVGSGSLLLAGFGLLVGFVCYNFFVLFSSTRR